MALFNNFSFNIGFFCGLNRCFSPTIPFFAPFNPFISAPFSLFTSFTPYTPFTPMFSNPFDGFDMFEKTAEPNYNNSFYPIFSDMPKVNFNFDFANNNNSWNNNSYNSFWSSNNYSGFNNNYASNYTYTPTKPKTEAKNTSKTEVKPSGSPSQKTGDYTTNTTKASNSGRLHSLKITGKVNHDYTTLSRSQAEAKAKKDSNLEDLRETSKQYNGWQLKANSFNHDITFAKSGTGRILQKASEMTGMKFIITSALGTGEGKTPHKIGNGYASHHNAENPKLDISLTVYDKNGKAVEMDAKEMANKLWATGLFSHILEEPATHHLDVQINPEVLKSLNVVA